MEVIIIAIVIIFAVLFTVVIGNYVHKCDSLEFRVETLEEEIETLKEFIEYMEYIEMNKEKQNDL